MAFASIGNLVTVMSPNVTAGGRVVGIAMSLLMFAVIGGSFFVPWNELGTRSTLWFVPFVVAMLAVGNYTDPLVYVAGIYVILLAAWIGLCQPRFTTLLLSPVLAVTFYVPLALRPHPERLALSTVIITVVSVALGEVLGLLRVRLENSRRELVHSNQRRSEALTRHSIDVSFVFGSDNRIRFVSPSVWARFGYLPEELRAVPLDTFLTELVQGVDAEDVTEILGGRFEGASETHRYELQLRHADGRWVEIEATVHNLTNDPDVRGIVAHVRDISERRSLEFDLFYRAYHDDLTGLANRAAFRERVTDEVESGHETSVIVLDLNGFKMINDTLGHRHGDQLLKAIANRLVAEAPVDSLVARLGGDEFAVVVRMPIREAVNAAEALIRAISQPMNLGSRAVSVGAEAGVAKAVPGLSAERLMENADLAMYEAKATPDVDVVEFKDEFRKQLVEKSELQTALQRAITNGEFVLHYQPQVNLSNSQWVGAEALIRWNRSVSELVGPAEFIPAAEESEIIVAMGRWVLMEACREASTWPLVDGRRPSVGVNVSSRQFVAKGFVDDVYDAIESSGIEPDDLVVEVTESVLISDFGLAREKLNALRSIGVKVSLDDFGTGYSSLRYLLELPFSTLKIDRSFISNATVEFNDYALLQTMNRLGHDLGLKTLIEGVETVEQARLVSSIGIDMVQGFYYSVPVDELEVVQIFANTRPEDVLAGVGREHPARLRRRPAGSV